MRTLLSAILATSILTGCLSGRRNQPGPPDPSEPEPRTNTPTAVLRLADKYLASTGNLHAEDRREIRGDFCDSFLRGFMTPGARMEGGTGAGRDGFVAGQEYRRAHPASMKEIMEGFGYTEIEAEGVWTVSFEHSGFRPRHQPQVEWWLWEYGGIPSDLPANQEMPSSGLRVRVHGYLSPSGHYGHLGSYPHEFFPTAIHGSAAREPELMQILNDDPTVPVDWPASTNRLAAAVATRSLDQVDLFAISPLKVFRMNVSSAALTNWFDYRLTLRDGAGNRVHAGLTAALRAEQPQASGQVADLRWGCVVTARDGRTVLSIACDEAGTNGVVNGACVRFTSRAFRDWAQSLLVSVYERW